MRRLNQPGNREWVDAGGHILQGAKKSLQAQNFRFFFDFMVLLSAS